MDKLDALNEQAENIGKDSLEEFDFKDLIDDSSKTFNEEQNVE